MMPRRLANVLLIALVVPLAASFAADRKPAPGDASRILLDDFENAPQGWTYIDGREFPGARGSLTLDSTVAHSGKRSYRLEGDFRGGGAYVGTWRDLASLRGRDVKELRLWVRAKEVRRVGVRLQDSSGQIHQKNGGVPLKPTVDWQELVLPLADLVGGEHWGGANDGRWHGPLKGFGLNLGKDGVADTKLGTLYLDDLTATPGAVVEGHPTLLAGTVTPASCRPGFGSTLTLRWDAEPVGKDLTVFVHALAPDGKMAFQADHAPPQATSVWSGRVEYAQKLYVPVGTPDGDYRLVVGLYDRTGRAVLKAGPGVTDRGGNAYQVGVLRVDARAPLPALPPPTLDLKDYTLTFQDEFNDLSVSPAGPGTRWCTATKETFGDARFVEQKDGFPFTVDHGVLHIAAARRNGVWCSGILASVDPKGRGFAQKFGYFEMRARFPKSPGMWPAFWLLGQPSLSDRSRPNPEVDVVEHYGAMPNVVQSTLHV